MYASCGFAIQDHPKKYPCFRFHDVKNSMRWVGFFNPLSPHDALKHDFTSLKTGLIFLQIRALE